VLVPLLVVVVELEAACVVDVEVVVDVERVVDPL
jgi:hypothetical protein